MNRDLERRTGVKKQVLYCGPSNSSVDVVTAFLKERLGNSCPKIIRIYSKAIEHLDFPVPRETLSQAQLRSLYLKESATKHSDVSLHHLIRGRGNKHAEEIPRYDQLFRVNRKTPEKVTDREISKYLNLVKEASIEEVKKYEVVLCTNAVSSAPRVVRGTDVEQIIIDEAGMCMEPECLIPLVAHQAANQIVLIGDHKQLRPIVKNEISRRFGLEISLFERYHNDAYICKPLKEQYRMHEDICEFPADHFYSEVGLITRYPEAWRQKHLPIWPNREKPIVFCHVEGVEKSLSVSTSDGNEQSKSNQAEIDHVVRIFRRLHRRHGVHPRHICVLSQYKAQCTEIRKTLVEKGYRNPTVNTVVAAQGEEWDYVILSCVRSLPEYEIEKNPSVGWRKRNMGFIVDEHQINVAITRARMGLIIIGNKNLLECDGMWKKLLAHYESRGCSINAEQFTVPRPAHVIDAEGWRQV